jgi:hypothetical protein
MPLKAPKPSVFSLRRPPPRASRPLAAPPRRPKPRRLKRPRSHASRLLAAPPLRYILACLNGGPRTPTHHTISREIYHAVSMTSASLGSVLGTSVHIDFHILNPRTDIHILDPRATRTDIHILDPRTTHTDVHYMTICNLQFLVGRLQLHWERVHLIFLQHERR